jgi:hypothetical protein
MNDVDVINYKNSNFFFRQTVMASAKKCGEKESEDQTEYKIESVVRHEIRNDLTCEFFVKWREWAPKYNTWEPLAKFIESPLLLKNFKIRSRNELIKAAGRAVDISEEAQLSIPSFAQIPVGKLRKMKAQADPEEYFPRGTETVKHAITRIQRPSSNLMLWKVDFEGFKAPRFVREALFTYYWPELASLYSKHFQMKEMRFKRLLEAMEGHCTESNKGGPPIKKKKV